MAKPSSWLTSKTVSAARRGVRTLTNNPTRGSENWSGFRNMSYGVRSVRRLMKRDQALAQGTPPEQLLTGTAGVVGKTGASPGVRVVGHTEGRQTRFGTGQRVIRNRGINNRLRRR